MKHLFTTVVCCLLWQITLQAQQLNFGWVNGLVTAGGSSGKAITVDAMGNNYTVGSALGIVDFNPGFGIDTVNFYGVFITKQDEDENFKWVATFKQIYLQRLEITDIAPDALGNVYVTGSFDSIVDFDPGPGVYTLNAGNSKSSTFIVKLDNGGNFKWAKAFSNLSGWGNVGTSITVDLKENVYVSGWFNQMVDFDPGPATYIITTNNYDTYCSKLDSLGNLLWVKNLAVNGFRGQPTITDQAGNVYITGIYSGTVDFDLGPGIYNLNAIDINSFVLKLDSLGNFLWAKDWGSSNVGPYGIRAEVSAMTLDKIGNIYFIGDFLGAVDFDPGPAYYRLFSKDLSTYSRVILKLNPTGNFVWAKKEDGYAKCEAIKVDGIGNIYIVGKADSTYDFDPGPAIYKLQGNGYSTGFINTLDTNCTYKSAIFIGGMSNYSEAIYDLDVDSYNNLYIVGDFSSTVDFDPGLGISNLTALGYTNAFIAKYGLNLLPLTLIRFSAIVQNNKKVLLQWQTAQEENTSHFIIERSTNGVEYLSIGKVKAAGYSAAQRNYTYIDTSLSSSNVYYYRLKMIDKDGSFTYSKVEKINISRINKLVVYPNPTKNSIRIFSGKSNMGFQSIKVISSLGRTVKELFNVSSLELSESGVEIDLKDLTPGIYFVQVTDSSGHISTQKVIKQ